MNLAQKKYLFTCRHICIGNFFSTSRTVNYGKGWFSYSYNNIFTRSLFLGVVVVLKSIHKHNSPPPPHPQKTKRKKIKCDCWLTLLMIFSNASGPFSWMYFSAAVRMSSGLLKTSFFLGTYQMLTVRGLTKRGLTKCS